MRAELVTAIVLTVALPGCDWLFSVRDRPTNGDAGTDAQDVGIRLVQEKVNALETATMVSVTLDPEPTRNNVVVMIGGSERGVLMPPTGGGVTSWYPASQAYNNQNLEIWYGVVDAAAAPVQIRSTATAGHMRLAVSEWEGLDTAALYDAALPTEGTASDPIVAGPIDTNDAPDLVIVGFSSSAMVGPGIAGGEPGATWIHLASPPPVPDLYQQAWYQVVSTPDSYSAQTQATASWDAGIAAFRIAR